MGMNKMFGKPGLRTRFYHHTKYPWKPEYQVQSVTSYEVISSPPLECLPILLASMRDKGFYFTDGRILVCDVSTYIVVISTHSSIEFSF